MSPVVYFRPHSLERTTMSDTFAPDNFSLYGEPNARLPATSQPTEAGSNTPALPAAMVKPIAQASAQALHLDTSPPASNDLVIGNPCLSCGACCAHFRVSFYCGEIADGNGAGMVPPELVTQVGPLRAAMKGTEFGYGRCIALSGEVGSPDVRCSIYPLRPSPCREFEPWLADGSPEPDCQRARARFGLPPLPGLFDTHSDDPQPHAA